MTKAEVFKTELSYIKNERLRENGEKLVSLLPNYFFKIAASSTGKYHPAFTLGDGGLVRHTKVAVKIASELLYNNQTTGSDFTDDEKDLIIIALIIHDGLKLGHDEGRYTVMDHPLLISQLVTDNMDNLTLTKEEEMLIKDMLETHMGEWVKDFKGNEVLEKPISKYQKFAHMCDYLASRKFLNVNFTYGEIE